MLNNMLEMDLKPATDPTTAPKPTSAQVLMTGRARCEDAVPVMNQIPVSIGDPIGLLMMQAVDASPTGRDVAVARSRSRWH